MCGASLLLRFPTVAEGEGDVVVQEAAARFGVAGGGDGGRMATILVQEVVGRKDDVGSIVQVTKQGTTATRELVGDLGIEKEGRVVHRRRQIATIKQEHGTEREAPRGLQLVAQAQSEFVVEDVLHGLGSIAVGIMVPSELVAEFGTPRVGVVGQGKAVAQVRIGLAVVDARDEGKEKEDRLNGIYVVVNLRRTILGQ